MSLSVKGCWAKIRYATEDAAMLAAGEHDTPMRAYPCRDRRGLHWHLTRRGAVKDA